MKRKLKTLNNGHQIFENYTQDDLWVWTKLLKNQKPNFQYFSEEYLDCMHKIGLHKVEIPNFEEINSRLHAANGWGIFGVMEIVEIEDFLNFMNKKRFPATTWVRGKEEMEYLEEPDMFHDVFGHTPLLMNRDYANFLYELGMIGLRFKEHPEITKMVQRVYWFTVEFGLINEKGNLKAYGAGVISSEGELLNSLSSRSEKRTYDVLEVIKNDFRTDIFQSKYYVIESFEDLYNSLETLRNFFEEETLTLSAI